MDDAEEMARLLDILGNRNRRRIIELLRQKPCFVTEISETLMISPKAVIEHLQMMEREAILSCQTDDRRRKYYFLANDIVIDVSLAGMPGTGTEHGDEAGHADEQVRQTTAMLGRMIRSHDRMIENLEQLNHDIEIKLTDLAHNHKDIFRGERELTVVIALSHEHLALDELAEATHSSREQLAEILRRLEKKGIIERKHDRYMLRGVHAE